LGDWLTIGRIDGNPAENKENMSVKILLLQARHSHDTARFDERRSFARQAGLDEEQVIPFDLLTRAPLTSDIVKYDALMIGGSGDFYVSKRNLPGYEQVLNTLNEIVDHGHPTFASCFGFQLLVAALGGEISYDERSMEVGTYQIDLTEDGKKDELFGQLPKHFMAQLGHKDRVDQLPSKVLNLATSQNSPSQSIRIPDKPIWATQFHPELSAEENLRRFRQYIKGYASMMTAKEIEETLARFQDSPATDYLIPGFMEIVFG
jgi:GMP synthase (glutamine-hydrolysing)